MQLRIKFPLFIASLFLGTVAFASLVFARESLFKPVIADIDAAVPGLERIAVTEDGSVMAFTYEGNLLPGFPVWIEGFVPATSPVVANVLGDGFDEIIVVARNDQNSYRVYALSSQGQILSSADVNGEIYYDPVILTRQDAQYDDILVASITGNVQRFRFENNVWSVTSILQLDAVLGLAVTESELVINYPERNTLEMYSEINGTWGRRSSMAMPSPVLYPVTITSDGYFIAILRNGQLASINKISGEMRAGFPVDLQGTALGPVLISDIQSDNAGPEFVITFSDGHQAVLRTDGTVLTTSMDKEFISLGFETDDALSHAGYSLLNAYVSRLTNQQINRIVSYLGRIRIPNVVVGNAEIDVSINGNALANGGIYTFGAVNIGETRDVTLTIHNQGQSSLQLNGNPLLAGPDAALFAITTQPRNVIASQTRTQVSLRFTAQSTGNKSTQISIVSNDADESPYTIVIRADVVQNIIRDGTMEAPLNASNWRNWAAGAQFEKSTAFAVSPTQSMHHRALNTHSGFQQLNVPVRAGQRYRYSLRYKLLAGRLETNLGIRNSNTDFEGKAGVVTSINNQWQTYTRDFTVPQNFAGDFRVIIRVRNGEAYIDDVVLEEIVPVATSIVIDGTMEAEGIGPWVRFGSPLVMEKTGLTTHSGLQSFHIISRANYGFQQTNIILQPGRQYRFRAWYRNAGGTLIPRISTTNSSVDFEFPNGNVREPLLGNTNGEWRLYERVFTARADYAGSYRVVFMHSNSDIAQGFINLPQGEVWVDDVTIEEAP